MADVDVDATVAAVVDEVFDAAVFEDADAGIDVVVVAVTCAFTAEEALLLVVGAADIDVIRNRYRYVLID